MTIQITYTCKHEYFDIELAVHVAPFLSNTYNNHTNIEIYINTNACEHF